MTRLLSLISALLVFAVPMAMPQDVSEEERRIAELAASLRCIICDGNTSVYDAVEYPIGRDMLALIETRVRAGDSDEDVRTYFTQRYGDAVLMPTDAIEPVLALSVVDARTEAISKTLRCVVCQNQSIYDSNAPLAEDMRRLVRKRVLAGDSDEAAREYLRSRYGDYVLMSPPFQLNTVLLWVGPLILVVLGAYWFAHRLRQTSPAAPEILSEADRARIEAAISGEEPRP